MKAATIERRIRKIEESIAPTRAQAESLAAFYALTPDEIAATTDHLYPFAEAHP